MNPRNSRVIRCSVPSVMRVLLTIVALYIALASAIVWLIEVRQFRAYNIYYLAVMMAVAALLSVSLWRRRREIFSDRRPVGALNAAAILVLGAIAWIIYRYPHLYSVSLWIDEVTQFYGDQNLPKFVADPALFAAIQQQPPIDYYLSAFSRILFGANESAVLFHSILFGGLSFFLFLLWLIQIGFPAILAAIPIIIFASHHSLLRFSSEARPISLGVFFSLATLIFSYESLSRRHVSAIFLGASSLLLLNSVGFQPIFFVAVLAVSLLPVCYVRLSKKEAARFLAALALLPILFFFPTASEIYRESANQNQFFSGPVMGVIWSGVTELEWNSFSSFFKTLNCLKWLPFIPLALMVLAAIWPAARFRRRRREILSWALAGLVFAFLFPLLFRAAWSLIDWYLHPYYVVLWVVGLIALSCQCGALLNEVFSKRIRGACHAGALVALGLTGAILLHLKFSASHQDMIAFERAARPNWHLIVDRVNFLKKPAAIIEIPYGRFGWGPFHAMAGDFYTRGEGIRILRLDDWSRSAYGVQRFNIEQAAREAEGRELWFMWSVNDPPGDKLPRDLENRIYEAIADVAYEPSRVAARTLLAHVETRSPREAISSVFARIVEAAPQSDRNLYLADALTADSLRKGDCEKARMWFKVMNDVASVKNPQNPPQEGLMALIASIKRELESGPCGRAGR